MTNQLTLALPEAFVSSDDLSLGDRVDTALETLCTLLKTEVIAVAWSSGKDSSACLVLVLLAYLRALDQGVRPAPLIVLHGDTLVESPPVRVLADEMLASLSQWCAKVGIPLVPIVYQPPLNQSYVVKTLSGTALPTFPEARRRICSASWKVEPAGRALNTEAVAATMVLQTAPEGGWPQVVEAVAERPGKAPGWRREPIVVLGSRLDESSRRQASMRRYGQRPDVVSEEEDGRRSLSPIALWSEMDVWELLGLAGTGQEYYRVWQESFADLIKLYRGAAGGCVIIPGKRAAGKPCSARFGCHACQAVSQDESGQALVEDPRWAYAAPLLRIRDHIAAIRHDLGKRSWLDCTEDAAGWLKVFPGAFSGATVRDLAHWYMSADRLEVERAERFRRAVAGGVVPLWDPYVAACRRDGREPEAGYMARMQTPQFCTFTPRNTVACDLYASLRGNQARPWAILEVWHRVWHQRDLALAPVSPPAPPRPLPEARWIPVPETPASDGLDPLAAALTETCGFAYDHDPVTGAPLLPQTLEDGFDVDAEAAGFVVDDEYRSSLRRRHLDPAVGALANVHYYLNIGCLTLSPGGRASLLARVRRLERWARLGLVEASPDLLTARSVSHRDYLRAGGTITSAKDRQGRLF